MDKFIITCVFITCLIVIMVATFLIGLICGDKDELFMPWFTSSIGFAACLTGVLNLLGYI